MLARLEVAPCAKFPAGSSTHVYLLDIPEQAWRGRTRSPAIARRFWPGEADMAGTLRPTDHHWSVRFFDGNRPLRSALFSLGALPLTLGSAVSVVEPDGEVVPYRVAAVSFS